MQVTIRGEDFAAALAFVTLAPREEKSSAAPGVLLDVTPNGMLRVAVATPHRFHAIAVPTDPVPQEIDATAHLAVSLVTAKALAKALGTKKVQKASLVLVDFRAREVTVRHVIGLTVRRLAAEDWSENARAIVSKLAPSTYLSLDIEPVAAFAAIAAKMGKWGHVRITARAGEKTAHLSGWAEIGRENSVVALAADVPLKMDARADWQEAFRAQYLADALAALKGARGRHVMPVFAIRQDGPGGPAELHLFAGDADQNARAAIVPTRAAAPTKLPDLRRGADFSKEEVARAQGRAIKAREAAA